MREKYTNVNERNWNVVPEALPELPYDGVMQIRAATSSMNVACCYVTNFFILQRKKLFCGS